MRVLLRTRAFGVWALALAWGCGGEGRAPSAEGAPGAPEASAERPAPATPSVAAEDTLAGPSGPGSYAPPLEGTEWRLVALPGAPEPPAGARATLLFDAETERMVGSTGCNEFDGAYGFNGMRLELAVTGITRRGCAEPLARLETDYLEALRRTGAFRLRGDTLELMGEAGVVARFAP